MTSHPLYRVLTSTLLILLINMTPLYSIERLPWFGEVYDINTIAKSSCHLYSSVNSNNRTKHHAACDYFLTLGASGVYSEDVALEIEATASNGINRHFGMDAINFTGRYLWLNDSIDDPISLTTGLTLSQVFKQGLHNLSAFHHGGIEGELHVALGKEMPCLQFWTSRLWGAVGIGIADMGSPWLRGDVRWEFNYWDIHRCELFLNTLWGCGGNALNVNHFKGYGPIAHRSIDAGIGYSYGFGYGIYFKAEYAFRVYARNCPQNANIIALHLLYPISL